MGLHASKMRSARNAHRTLVKKLFGRPRMKYDDIIIIV
jgi:hypothetical protein